MKRLMVAALIGIALFAPTAVAQAEDELGKRLLIVTATNCSDGSVPRRDDCRAARTMAFGVYGQRKIMQMLCTAPLSKTDCQATIAEFEQAIENELFGKKSQ